MPRERTEEFLTWGEEREEREGREGGKGGGKGGREGREGGKGGREGGEGGREEGGRLEEERERGLIKYMYISFYNFKADDILRQSLPW